jgi:hypothetical protein
LCWLTDRVRRGRRLRGSLHDATTDASRERTGGGAIHVFRSCIWQVKNSAFNSYLDPYNGGSARGTLSEPWRHDKLSESVL